MQNFLKYFVQWDQNIYRFLELINLCLEIRIQTEFSQPLQFTAQTLVIEYIGLKPKLFVEGFTYILSFFDYYALESYFLLAFTFIQMVKNYQQRSSFLILPSIMVLQQEQVLTPIFSVFQNIKSISQLIYVLKVSLSFIYSYSAYTTPCLLFRAMFICFFLLGSLLFMREYVYIILFGIKLIFKQLTMLKIFSFIFFGSSKMTRLLPISGFLWQYVDSNLQKAERELVSCRQLPHITGYIKELIQLKSSPRVQLKYFSPFSYMELGKEFLMILNVVISSSLCEIFGRSIRFLFLTFFENQVKK